MISKHIGCDGQLSTYFWLYSVAVSHGSNVYISFCLYYMVYRNITLGCLDILLTMPQQIKGASFTETVFLFMFNAEVFFKVTVQS